MCNSDTTLAMTLLNMTPEYDVRERGTTPERNTPREYDRSINLTDSNPVVRTGVERPEVSWFKISSVVLNPRIE